MKLVLAIVTSVVALMVLATTAFGQPFCVGTYNVNWENTASDQMIDAIRHSNADCACIQETTNEWFGLFKLQINDLYPYAYKVNQFAFLSKTPLYGIEANDNSLFATATLAVEGRPLQLVNLHLSPLSLPNNANAFTLLTELSDRDEKHVRELDNLLKTIDLKTPTIIVGDFNGISTSKAAKRLQEKGLADSFALVNNNPDQVPTWDLNRMLAIEAGQHPGRLTDAAGYVPIGLRLDFVYHTVHFETVASQVLLYEGSDHSLVVSKLRLKPDGE